MLALPQPNSGNCIHPPEGAGKVRLTVRMLSFPTIARKSSRYGLQEPLSD